MSYPAEQKVVTNDQHVEKLVTDTDSDERITRFTEKEQKAIVRRIDRRLVVTLGCLYFISLLDRTNLGAASVAG